MTTTTRPARRRRTRRLALALALVSATVVAACGGDDDDSGGGASDDTAAPTPALEPLEIVERSIDTTRESGTSRISHHLVSTITAFSANEYSEGVADLQTGNGEWTQDMSDSPIGLVPVGTPPEEIVKETREIEPNLYVSLPPAFEDAGISETWISVPADLGPADNGFTGFEGLSPRIALSARFQRPDVAFAILDTVSAAREVGPATIRGKTTTRYSVDVKLRTMLEEVGLMFFFGNPTEPAELEEIDNLTARAAHVDVFIDELGRIRELLVDADLSIVAPSFDPPQDPRFWRSLRLKWDFFDYGIDVDVEEPPASEVRTAA
jgi:hypothetical protein